MRIALFAAVILCFSSLFMWIGWNLSTEFILDQVCESVLVQQIIPYDANVRPLEIEKINTSNSNIMMIWVLVTIISGSFIAYIFSGISIKPLHQLSNAMENITVQTLKEKLPCSHTKDELSMVTNAFNNMVDNLEKSFERERQFSANVAHELRTPLAVLLTKYEVFHMQDTHTIEEYAYVLETSKKRITYLHTMVENLLSLYRNDENLKIEKVNISTLLFDIVEMLEEKALAKGVNITLNCEDIYIDLDINLITCALFNIIDNAIIYNNKDGEIKISVHENNHMLELSIKDTGIGIETKEIEDIFNAFYQVKSLENIGESHCGLGLALAKKIITLHKGSILVESEINVGSQFNIELPL